MSEAQEQKAVIEWCSWNSDRFEELKWIFHCPNEAKYIGLAIEMKYGKNKCTIEQVKWLDWLYKQGYMCKVCWSADDAIAVIKEYLGIK